MGTTSSNTAPTLKPIPDPSPISTTPVTRATITQPSSHRLPEKPLVTIQPGKAWAGLSARDLWAYRELLYFLTWRDLKVRYKQTLLGVAWVVMQPLLMTVIFSAFLGAVARVPSYGVPFPLFVYVGLLPWTFFSAALNNSSVSIVGNAQLVTKVYFPRMIIPAAAITARLVDFAVAFVILAGMMLFYRAPLTANVLMLPPLVALVALLALACGLLISALNVKYRDVGVALPILIQLWMFVSPVLYPLALVPAKWRNLYLLNPLAGILEGFRVALLGGDFNWRALAISAAFALTLATYSVFFFRRVEKSFVDII
jgi:lipopolysaccharide transport system permease protein